MRKEPPRPIEWRTKTFRPDRSVVNQGVHGLPATDDDLNNLPVRCVRSLAHKLPALRVSASRARAAPSSAPVSRQDSRFQSCSVALLMTFDFSELCILCILCILRGGSPRRDAHDAHLNMDKSLLLQLAPPVTASSSSDSVTTQPMLFGPDTESSQELS
jgi:hypothetical protein